GNKTMADRLQSICVRRGWKCNIHDSTLRRKRVLYELNIVRTETLCLHGHGTPTNYMQAKIEPSAIHVGERVWCIANRLETLIVRRNGKVAIIGNSYWRHGSPNLDRD